MNECRCPQRPKEDVGSSGPGIAGTCNGPNMGTGNQTSILSKSNKCSLLLNPLSRSLFKYGKIIRVSVLQ